MRKCLPTEKDIVCFAKVCRGMAKGLGQPISASCITYEPVQGLWCHASWHTCCQAFMHMETVTLLANYLRNRKQRLKVGNCGSDWEPLSKGVTQGSMMGPILFNLFLNDTALFIKISSLTNYADDNRLIDHRRRSVT